MADIIYLLIAVLIMLPGFAGLLIPILPGIPYMFVVTFIYGLLTRFATLDSTELIILAVIAVLSVIIDYLSGAIGAKIGGAGKSAIGYGLIGLIVGMLMLPPLGGFLGLFIGIYMAEYLKHRNKAQASKVASASLVGSLVGLAINIVLALTFLVLFVFFSL